MNDAALHGMVRARIAEGRLPTTGSNRLVAKYGDGTLCSVCERAIARSEVMYLLGFGKDGAELVMDLPCFMAWVAARGSEPLNQRPQQESPAGRPARP